MNRQLILYILIGFAFTSCHREIKNKKGSKKIDYIVFGAYVGKHQKPWSIAIKVDKKGAYIDTTDSYLLKADTTFNFKTHPLDNKNSAIAITLFNQLPQSLIDKTKEKPNCPLCFEAGATYYLEIKSENEIIKYRTNCRIENCSDSLREYCNLINIGLGKIMEATNYKPVLDKKQIEENEQ